MGYLVWPIVAHVLILILGPRELGSHPSHTLFPFRSCVSAFRSQLIQRGNTLEAFRIPLAPTLLALLSLGLSPPLLQTAPAPVTEYSDFSDLI